MRPGCGEHSDPPRSPLEQLARRFLAPPSQGLRGLRMDEALERRQLDARPGASARGHVPTVPRLCPHPAHLRPSHIAATGCRSRPHGARMVSDGLRECGPQASNLQVPRSSRGGRASVPLVGRGLPPYRPSQLSRRAARWLYRWQFLDRRWPRPGAGRHRAGALGTGASSAVSSPSSCGRAAPGRCGDRRPSHHEPGGERVPEVVPPEAGDTSLLQRRDEDAVHVVPRVDGGLASGAREHQGALESGG